MDYIDICKVIAQLNSDNDIKKFVLNRIEMLENTNSVYYGINNAVIRDYIGKCHYLTSQSSKNNYWGADLVLDDYEFYEQSIKLILGVFKYFADENTCVDILKLYLLIVADCVHNYFSTYIGYESRRDSLYEKHWDDFCNGKEKSIHISVKEFADNHCGVCYEQACLIHNFLKILGVDSEMIIGCMGSDGDFGYHAYNIVYPNGFEGNKRVLFDNMQLNGNNYLILDISEEVYKKMFKYGFWFDLSNKDNTEFLYYKIGESLKLHRLSNYVMSIFSTNSFYSVPDHYEKRVIFKIG